VSTENTTAVLPVLPVKNTVLFPFLFMPLAVGRPSSIAAVEAVLATEDKTLIVASQRDDNNDQPGFDDLYPIATRAVVKKMARAEGGIELIVQGVERVRMIRPERSDPFLVARYEALPLPEDTSTEIEALFRADVQLAARVLELAELQVPVQIQQMAQLNDPLRFVFMLGSMLSLDVQREQALLEAPTRAEALRLLHGYLTHEAQVLELRQSINKQAATEMTKQQREYMLRQQMQAIQEELGEKTPEKAEAEELRKRLAEADLPEAVRKEAERELARLERMPTAAPDYQLTRTYLDFVIELPWRKASPQTIDLAHTRQVLDADHYDLEEIKERILENLAVLKLNPQARAPILCFVGPPGVGKTSLGQSIATSLGRAFERMSLGGLHDEAELRGHRRTYIGAMPGRLLQAIRRAGVKNPVLMLDEIDKLGRDYRGDPASALLEILDPAQNNAFRDNYLDLPFDLSQVFFITTANTLDTIPQPLLDRMEVIRLSGYTEEDKLEIARRFLLPRRLKETGLSAEQLTVATEAVQEVIRSYTREAGVRELERMLGRVARKVARRFAEGNTEHVTVSAGDLTALLGPPRRRPERQRQQQRPGVATGLAWTEAGGDVLYVEATLLHGGHGLKLTGQLGKVMKESARAALSYVWAHAPALGIDPRLFRRTGVHIHVPAGAVPKDGPSAGVALVTALTSVYSNTPVRNDVAMTGEITLTGLVLPVGGIKEKVLAAARAGVRHVILPRDNEADLNELPENVRQSLTITLAEQIEDVLAAALPQAGQRLEPVPL
jgi:ATP-dependent Lon protease